MFGCPGDAESQNLGADVFANQQERTAQETLDIYAPLAHRLGMQEVKVQLEDLALATLHPKRYSEISQMVQDRAPERDRYLSQCAAEAEGLLVEA